MLSNPHWDAPSFSSFETWLEGKDANETYPYSNVQGCACAQYLRHVGKYHDHWLAQTGAGDVMATLNKLAGPVFMEERPEYKFGRLLERVREHRKHRLETV